MTAFTTSNDGFYLPKRCPFISSFAVIDILNDGKQRSKTPTNAALPTYFNEITIQNRNRQMTKKPVLR